MEKNKSLLTPCKKCGVESYKNYDSAEGLCFECGVKDIKYYEGYELEPHITVKEQTEDKVILGHCFDTEAKNFWKQETENLTKKKDLAFIRQMPKELIEKVVEFHGGKIVWEK